MDKGIKFGVVANMIKLIFLCISSLLLSGCAHDQKYDGFPATLAITYTSKAPIAICVQDRRPYVIDHDKGENFAGIARGGYGIPMSMLTFSGKPLAVDMVKSLESSIGRNGVKPIVITISPFTAREVVIKTLKESGAKNILLVTLIEWKFDTYINPTIYYNVEMEAMDDSGKVLAQKKTSGSDDSEGSSFTAIFDATTAAQVAFKEKMELLYNGEISQALHE